MVDLMQTDEKKYLKKPNFTKKTGKLINNKLEI